MDTFVCVDCGQEKPVQKGVGGTGYGYRGDSSDEGQKVCYACCGVADKKAMETRNQFTLYLVEKEGEKPEVTNWPGTLRFPVHTVSKSPLKTRFGQRTDVWFRDHQGSEWWGRNTGDNQLLRCRKKKAA